jgi:hypothetical protein
VRYHDTRGPSRMNELEQAVHAHLVGQHGFHADLVETKIGSCLTMPW